MKTAVLGYGTVGRSLCEALDTSRGMEVKWILRRPQSCTAPQMTADVQKILEDPEVEAVCDALPGIHPSYEYMKAALSAGKAVVTANKAALCFGFAELTALAEEHRVPLCYEAACGGTVPCIAEARRIAKTNAVTKVYGILNGTTNFILDKMDREDADFDTVLREAQRLGYAELDPTADLSGFDVKNKIVILSNTAYQSCLAADFPVCGIEKLTMPLLKRFKAERKMLKLMGISVVQGESFAIGVVPVVLPAEAPEAHVPANYNMITLVGSSCGEVKLYGQGAGGRPTADAMLRDLAAVRSGEALIDVPRFDRRLTYDPSLLSGTGYIGDAVMHGTLEELDKKAAESGSFLAFEPD